MDRTIYGFVTSAVAMSRRALIVGVVAVGVSTGFYQPTVGHQAHASSQAGEFVNALPDGVAMDGFDVVAYFDGAPAKGGMSHSVEHKDKTWLFRSAENAAAFAADPDAYEPRYNGWCAYAVSEGYGAEVDFVDGWSVIDGKLYLNWDAETREAFVAELSTRIERAERNWPDLHAGLLDGSADMYTHAGEGVGIVHPQQLD